MSVAGQFLYVAFYKPAGIVKNIRRQGLFWSVKSWSGGRQLRKLVSHELREAKPNVARDVRSPGPTFVYLGGAANIDLLFASIASLHVHWPICPNVALLSDGTLTAELSTQFSNCFPGFKAYLGEEVEASIDRVFPQSDFPELRALRRRFLLARKFMDLCAIPSQWIVFVDADTLFLDTPHALVEWAAMPASSFYLLDRCNAYSYPLDEMAALLQVPCLPAVNTGLFSLQPSAVDWQEMEGWYAKLSKTFPDNHFVEQSLLAMMFSRIGARQLPAEYICEPDVRQVELKQGCFHHYVWPCRHFLYRVAWRAPIAAYKRRRGASGG